MRIPFPERIPIPGAIAVSIALGATQLVEHTPASFVFLHSISIVMWAFAFNYAGGFRRITGAYIFWFGLLIVFVGTTVRALTGESGTEGLQAPLTTMAAYAASIALLLGVAICVRFVMDRSTCLPQMIDSAQLNYRTAAIGCLFLGLCLNYAGFFLPAIFFGQVFTTLFHVSTFLMPVAVLLATIDAVQSSGGRSAVSWISFLAMFSTFFQGFIGFSKEGLLTPVLCFVIGVAYARFNLRWIHYVALGAYMVLFQLFLYPVAQYGRFLLSDEPSFGAQIKDEFVMVRNAAIYRDMLHNESEAALEAGSQYFDRDLGIAYRFTRWPSDDPLIDFSAKGHRTGYKYIGWTFINWFPHIIAPHKDALYVEGGGNYYAREMGWLPDDNLGTGISFGAPAEAFHIDGWTGVILLQPAIWLLFFLVMEWICGDLRLSPWGTPLVVALAHIAPEGGITGLITQTWLAGVALTACILFAVYIAPVLGTVVGETFGASRSSRVGLAQAMELEAT